MNQIIPNLFIADESEVHQACKKKMVDAVLDLRHEAFTEYEHDFYLSVPWIEYKHIPIEDGHELPKDYFDKAIKFIKGRLNARNRLIVHCQAGVSRSTVTVLAYMIEYNCKTNGGKSIDELIDILITNRPMTWIHPILWNELNSWCAKKDYGELPPYNVAMGKCQSLWDNGYWVGLYGGIDKNKLGESWVNVF